MAYGKEIGAKAPPPDKLKSYRSGDADDMGGTEEAEPAADAEAEDKAARVASMQEVLDAFKGGDAEAACNALDAYLDTRK